MRYQAALHPVLEDPRFYSGFRQRARPNPSRSKAPPAPTDDALAAVRDAAEREGYQVEGFAATSRAAHQPAEAGIESNTFQEITNPDYHLIALGLERTITADQPATSAAADVHAQGGVAIAAHPSRGIISGLPARRSGGHARRY